MEACAIYYFALGSSRFISIPQIGCKFACDALRAIEVVLSTIQDPECLEKKLNEEILKGTGYVLTSSDK